MRCLAVALLTLFALLPVVSTDVRAADIGAPIRALFVTGGCCHDYTKQKIILTEGISARANVTWTIVHEGDGSQNYQLSIYTNANWSAGYDVVVHDECFPQLSDTAWVTNIAAAHRGGVPAVILHCGVMTYRAAQTNDWHECVGMTSNSHETQRDITVVNMLPAHPVMRGLPPVWTNYNDELYRADQIWSNMVTLARAPAAETPGTNYTVIWVNDFGGTRVFATSLGHENSTVSNQLYLDVVARGLLWACGRLDDTTNPYFVDVTHTPTNSLLRWQSVPGWSYQIEAAAEITGPWVPLFTNTVVATNILSSLTVTNFDSPRGFFRVRSTDP